MKLSLRFWGLVLAAAHAAAQCSGQITISSQSDADALAGCDTINGDVSISSDASGTITLSDLEGIRGGFTIEGTSNLNNLRADDLESITGPVNIKDNRNLAQVSLSSLQDVGGDLNVEGNGNMNQFALNDLETLNGGMNLDGSFNQLSFSNLARINGETNIRSTGSFSCGSLQSSGGDDEDGGNGNVFSGSSYTCRTGADATSTTSSATSTSTSSSSTSTGTTTSTSSSTSAPTETTIDTPSGSPPLSGGGIAGIVVAAVVVVLLIILFLWWFLRRRRKNAAVPPIVTTDEKTPPSTDHTPEGGPPGAVPGAGDIGTDKNVARKPLAMTQAMQDRLSGGSTGMPAALVAGDRSSMQHASTSPDDGALFLHPIPKQRPSEADVPMLDSGYVHEVSAEPDRAIYEMDAGPVISHQQPINR